MAVVVSHAMRRFPTSPPDSVYSSYGLRGESSHKTWTSSEEGESALSRSMRYADPWLYGTVRAHAGFLVAAAPAFVLCTCPDYKNGTKRSSKKSPTTCKKCKGTRLPLSPLDTTKYGTVRCYPTSTAVPASTPLRAGTMRVNPSSRPSILPSSDPYDLMRRSRLSVSETTASNQFRARSISPNKGKTSESRSLSASRSKGNSSSSVPDYNSTFGRRSILECDINPYELMTTHSDGDVNKDKSITLVNGQRIRVRPRLPDQDYEDVQIQKDVKKSSTKIPSSSLSSSSLSALKQNPSSGAAAAVTLQIHKTNEKESDCMNNRFKSILKKRTTTFNDTDSNNGPEHSPSPTNKTGSHFYIPMPCNGITNNNTPRKKVQFLVENESDAVLSSNDDEEEPIIEHHPPKEEKSNANQQQPAAVVENVPKNDNKKNQNESPEKFECKLRRSVSDHRSPSKTKVVFHDSMALRTRLAPHEDVRKIFDEKDLERLDGITSRTRKISPNKPRPNVPPPPPPPAVEMKSKIPTLIKTENKQEIVVNNNESNKEEGPPSAPPRKRSNNKQPQMNIKPAAVQTVRVENQSNDSNKTVVQVNGSAAVHKLQIKNEFTENNVQTINVLENPQRKTSILINGDDCYSTVNVNDNVPLYQSSVVVKDTGSDFCTIQNGTSNNNKKSSSVYITGSFNIKNEDNDEKPMNNSFQKEQKEVKDYDKVKEVVTKDIESKDKTQSDSLDNLLRDPVEAVRRNLVPHVCGKSDVSRRPRNSKFNNISPLYLLSEHLLESPLEENMNNSLEDSFARLRNYESINNDDLGSEHSSSTQYELMDAGSDCYTDHSNRSSVTEEELANRTKFYELLADSAAIEVFDNEDHHYESIKINTDPIYEEIEIPPPLPANPPPPSLLDDLQLDKEYTTRSIFEGASKYDILSYLVDAKERGIVQEDYSFNNDDDAKDSYNRVSHMSTVSDSSEDNSLIISDDKATFQKTAEVERNDSGVGSETSKSSLSKYRSKEVFSYSCEDCESVIDTKTDNDPLLCRKCIKKRSERKEIITEIVETEEKYSRDLQIILEEFYQPMLVAGLLTPEQLSAIFLNVEELLENSQALAERLRESVEIALEQGDDDLLTVNIGKLFLEAAPMLHSFETYCVRQGPASLLLASLEKEKELLRIFLKVSQMENTLLRRMNLNSFLMVPVQRVTKYPLLLARLYKVTPSHHETREQLKEAQHKIELHLNHMNSETKDVPSKLWRRIGSSTGRRSSAEMDLVNIKLRKIAVDVLEWNHDEAKFALEGKLLFTQPTDNNWRKGRTIKLTPVNALLVINGKPSTTKIDRPIDENGLIFPRHSGVREAALLLVRDKNGRYSLLREPLYLDRCVIAADPAWQSYFEVQELLGKDTFIFKADDEDQTHIWYRQLQFYAQGMGTWRKRRNALANIMINGMGLRS